MNLSNVTIELTHYERGPMRVHIWDEATWWMRRRTWSCPDDPELGSFEDGDFEETPAAIDLLLLAARNDQIASSQVAKEGAADRLPLL